MRRTLLIAALAATVAAIATSVTTGWADDGMSMSMSMPTATPVPEGTVFPPSPRERLTRDIARARVALAPFATSLPAARAAGYSRQITPMMPNMGFHYMDPSVTGFRLRHPPILVYIHHGRTAQLVAAEWVFTAKPPKAPLPGARYGSFPAACHYADGTFTPHSSQAACAATSQGGAAFVFWHPRLVTLHLWLWYPNPAGIFHSTNPLVAPFNDSK
jgi:hypothetical protein